YMVIQNPQPTIIPANPEEKVFPHLWITNLRVRSSAPSEGSILIDVSPYDSETGEILSNETRRIYVSNLWEAAQAVPELSAALSAVFNAVAPVIAWQTPEVVPKTWTGGLVITSLTEEGSQHVKETTEFQRGF